MKKLIKTYIKTIKKNLPCLNSAMRKMLNDLKLSIYTYIKDNNIVEFKKIIEHFGTAEDIAKEFAVGVDNSYIKSYKLKKRITVIAISILVTTMIALLTLVTYIIASSEKNQPVSFDSKITQQGE